MGEADRKRIRSLGRVAPAGLRAHQALFGRPMTTIPAIGPVRGRSRHIIDTVLAAMIELGLVPSVLGVKRNRIDESIVHLEPLNRGDAA